MRPSPAPSLAPSPLDILWQPPAIMSIMLVAEGLALILALAPDAVGDRWVFFGLASLTVQWIVLLALAGLYAMRAPLARRSWQQTAWIAVLLLLGSTCLVGTVAWVVLHRSWSLTNAAWLGLLWRMSAIALSVGLLGLAAMQNYWHARLLAVRVKQAELEALQARIRPHFLFNTLNTAAALVHARPADAEQLILDLADLFRAALAGPRNIPLAEELALARRYLEIEALRFGDRLRVHWRLPDPLPAVMVPALSIQPLVENAIRHGVELSPSGGDIVIEVDTDEETARILVSNTLAIGNAVTDGHQVGQASARARIGDLTGGRGRLDTRSEDGRYIATITLPLH